MRTAPGRPALPRIHIVVFWGDAYHWHYVLGHGQRIPLHAAAPGAACAFCRSWTGCPSTASSPRHLTLSSNESMKTIHRSTYVPLRIPVRLLIRTASHHAHITHPPTSPIADAPHPAQCLISSNHHPLTPIHCHQSRYQQKSYTMAIRIPASGADTTSSVYNCTPWRVSGVVRNERACHVRRA